MFQLIVILSLYLSIVHADYTIDDGNYSVLKFSENPTGPVWGPFGSGNGEVLEIRLPNGTYQTIDATQCYDGTYTYAACNTSNNCAVQFSFTGSGITIYVLQAGPQGMSASLSIDSGTAQTATLAAPPPPQYYISHVTLFNVQNIPSGMHTAVMTVLDWNGSFSGMMLDYIDVNQAQVSGPTSSSPSRNSNSTPAQSPSSTSANQKSSSSHPPTASQQADATQTSFGFASVASGASVLSFQASGSGATAIPSDTASGNGTVTTSSSSSAPKNANVAAVAGGVVGGAGVLALTGVVFLCVRRRRRDREQADAEAAPHPLSPPPPEARFTGRDVAVVNPFAGSAAPVLSPIRSSLVTGHPWHPWTDSLTVSVPNVAVWDPRNPGPGVDIYHHTHGTSGGNNSATPTLLMDGSTSPQSSRPAMPDYIYPNEKSRPAITGLTRSTSTSSTLTQPQHQGHQSVPSATPTNTAQLTDEQADFVNTLFTNNVPGPVVARVLERMLTNPQSANASVGANDPELHAHLDPNNLLASPQAQTPIWDDTAWTSMGEIDMAPPSYDYVRAQR